MKINEIIGQILQRNKIILYLVIVILVNVVSSTLFFKFDLTENNVYSLSEISEDVVAELQEPLNVKIFFSENLPAPYNTVHRYLKDLMEEYSEAANDNFSYEFIDVEEDRDLANDFGIFPIQVREIESDQLKFRNAYMGLSIVHGDLIEKLTSITEAEGLEYRITTLIKKMTGKIDTLLKLDNPIRITLYASSNLPIQGVKGLDKKVGEIAKKISIENYNKVEFKFIDPAEDKTAMSAADVFGVASLSWQRMRGMDGKFINPGEGLIGIVVELGDKFETIQLLSRSLFGQYVVGNLETLHDSLNTAIDNVINVNPGIGYITGHNEVDLNDAQMGGGALKSVLSDMYDIKEINLAEEDIPDNINVIIINGPKTRYTDEEILKIDQFIMEGKSVLFAIDSFFEMRDQQAMRFGGGKPAVFPVLSGMDNLLGHYGINVNKDIVLDKKCYEANQQGLNGQKIYFAPIIEEKGLNENNVITKSLKMMVWPKGSSISLDSEKMKDAEAEKTVLVRSSEESWLMKGRVNFMPFSIIPPSDSSEMSVKDLSVLVEGKFTSYFKGKEIPEKEKGKKKKQSDIKSKDFLEKSLKPARIFVAGTSEISLSNVVDENGKSLNAIFMHNVVDFLAGNINIPEMRTKGIQISPLKDSGDKSRFIIKLFNIAGLPLVVIILGIVVWRKRLARKKRIMKEFAV
ncbi:MAG: Gldg family protein [Spirochaetes bacterium]|nr:Gldg family protein [Spirochaetota bacterium]